MVKIRLPYHKIVFVQFSFSSILFTLLLVGCSDNAMHPGYRESQGNVAKYSISQTDQVLKVTWFLRLSDNTVIRPEIHLFRMRKTGYGIRRVEERAPIGRSLGKNLPDNGLHLPTSDEIATYLLLVRKPLRPKNEQPIPGSIKYDWSDWCLLEISAKDVSQDSPIIIPAYNELSKRELSKEQKDLLKELVGKYEKIEAAAIKRMNTPVK